MQVRTRWIYCPVSPMTKSSPPTAKFLFPNSHWEEPLLLKNPVERIVAYSPEDVEPALAAIDGFLQEQKFFLAGYVSYEVGHVLMGLPFRSNKSHWPLIDFYVFSEKSQTLPADDYGRSAVFDFSQPPAWPAYSAGVEEIHEYLKNGETYQVNYTFQNSCRSFGNPYSLFKKLQATQKSRYSVFAEVPAGEILSLSPELFFSKIDNKIVTKPMKGTLPLGVSDVPAELKLKLQAENLMIVDLLRSDLARIARPESVRVTQLMAVEQYSTLQQIVSTIEGEVERDIKFSPILKALFPCGSITGAPKRRTMEILSELEPQARGLYTGAIGYITPQGDMQFNVAIRTLWGANNEWSYGVGGGIVYDSKAKDEFDEALLKAHFLKASNNDFSIFETMCLDAQGEIGQLERHLHRLRSSALHFGFTWDESIAEKTLSEIMKPHGAAKRVRLDLHCDGRITVGLGEMPEIPNERRVCFSPKAVSSDDIFLRHKTSMRELYDTEYARVQGEGFYEVLFMNEKSEVTESSRSNIFVKIRGEWLTPPLSSGVLPGVERKAQIESKQAKEKILFLEDILDAEEVVLTNSLRGCVRVEVIP